MNKKIPVSFLISTFLLVSSGYTATRIRIYFQEENAEKVIRALGVTLLLGLLFTSLQITGWKELQSMGIDFQGIPSGSFLYVLSGIHVFHLLGAMIFAVILWAQLRNRKNDEVKRLILFTNPFEKNATSPIHRLLAIYGRNLADFISPICCQSMNLTIETAVRQDYLKVKEGFDEKLFTRLSPPFPPVKLIKFDGSQKGDVVSLELNFFTLQAEVDQFDYSRSNE